MKRQRRRNEKDRYALVVRKDPLHKEVEVRPARQFRNGPFL